MSRFARARRVVVWEEPAPNDGGAPSLDVRTDGATGVTIAVPRLPPGLDEAAADAALSALLDEFTERHAMRAPVCWYYTPMMLGFSRRLAERAACVVYDCMDELSNFRFAPPRLRALEQDLFDLADVVFTGGWSLYEAKRGRHANIHPFPSSVDRAHFAAARAPGEDPADQAPLPRPRFGYYGVIDERMDLELLGALADARPEWSLVMVGPVVKVAPEDLPRRPNLHYLGAKTYAELPAYLRGWDVAIAPFAINEATRFISPTKTPEYLAGGKPVVSTAIVDVKRHYGDLAAVRIADDHAAFAAACETALEMGRTGMSDMGEPWLAAVDDALGKLSWDATFARMSALVDEAVVRRELRSRPAAPATHAAGRRAHYDAVVVGAGFAGAVLAERLAADAGKRVLVIDRRPHVAGNAFDVHDEAGVLIHQYGPHIFHTNSDEVVRHLSRFTAWRTYEHRVLASVRGQLVPIPINRTTLNALYGLDLRSDEAAAAFLAERAEPVERARTSEDIVVSAVGRELYELFFRGYTTKQWGVDPSELDKSVTARVPTRTSTDDRYFTDSFQAMPKHGFTRMFETMLDHENIHVATETDFADIRDDVLYDRLVFTGPVDEFFEHRYGPLPYRSLRFQHETHDVARYQPVGVVNYPAPETPYTRITEYKHLTGQAHPKTSITFEFPSADGDPYYPIPRPENEALYKRYQALALARPDVTFVGRLATYRYYNMDQVVGQALATYRRLRESGANAPMVRDVAAVA
ncbi:MAG: UDP-galactopyranose mutase [Caulobacteraceae bacterium]|nr:UDP-galactopyranose mutase [Caulobacter sp.]